MAHSSDRSSWWRTSLLVIILITSLPVLQLSYLSVNGVAIPHHQKQQHSSSPKQQTGFFVPHPPRRPPLRPEEVQEDLGHEEEKWIKARKEWLQRHMATKSAYPHSDRPYHTLGDVPPGYELAQVQLLCRHGTRFPSRAVSAAIATLSQKLKNAHISGSEWIREWSAAKYYPIEKGNLLAARGDVDLYMIGRRLATRYSRFLDKYPYDAVSYDIRSSAASRCTQSAHGFAIGFFEGRRARDPRMAFLDDIQTEREDEATGDSALISRTHDLPIEMPPLQPVDIYTIPKGLDQELAVKYSCQRWLSMVSKQPLVDQHQEAYIQRHIQPIADRLTRIFFPNSNKGSGYGLEGQQIITAKDVQLIYQLCGYEMAFYNDGETWCQILWRPAHSSLGNDGGDVLGWQKQRQADDVLLKEQGHDFLHLEYLSDLGDYYGYGAGIPFNKHLGRPLAGALVDSIDKILASEFRKTRPLSLWSSPRLDQTTENMESGDSKNGTRWAPIGRNLVKGHGGEWEGQTWLLSEPEDDDSAHRAILKFGHSETIMFLSTFLGLYDDGATRPLRGDQSGLEHEDRAFRASNFSSFAANMVFEVYRPLMKEDGNKESDGYDDNSDDNDRVSSKMRKYSGEALVRLLINENPHAIPGCSDASVTDSMAGHHNSVFCKWSIFRALLIERGAGQDFEGCCAMDNGGDATSSGNNESAGVADEQCLSTDPLPLLMEKQVM